MANKCKLRCAACNNLVLEWINDKCVPCYNKDVSSNAVKEVTDFLYTERKNMIQIHDDKINALRSRLEFLDGYILGYEARFEIRVCNWLRNHITYLFLLVRGFFSRKVIISK